jgi:hypothetical protein
MAGREGLEPSNARSKAWCLTSLATAQQTVDTPLAAGSAWLADFRFHGHFGLQPPKRR